MWHCRQDGNSCKIGCLSVGTGSRMTSVVDTVRRTMAFRLCRKRAGVKELGVRVPFLGKSHALHYG